MSRSCERRGGKSGVKQTMASTQKVIGWRRVERFGRWKMRRREGEREGKEGRYTVEARQIDPHNNRGWVRYTNPAPFQGAGCL